MFYFSGKENNTAVFNKYHKIFYEGQECNFFFRSMTLHIGSYTI